jgi:hypothetical protein
MNRLYGLADLDELVLRCRTDKARGYIAEAISCYHAGAYRATIVTTWIAVCYDIIDKLRELSLAGDPAASKQLEGFEKIRASHDIKASLAFEDGLLDIAKSQFELISPIEFEDLQRLRNDRNRCAHPTFISNEEAFEPPGELARLHIRSAVTHLLQQEPVQGRYALKRLVEEVYSSYFPTDKTRATAVLSSGAFARPRDSLVSNFVIVLLKGIFNRELEDIGTLDDQAVERFFTALQAVSSLQTEAFQKTLQKQMPKLIQKVHNENLYLVTKFLYQFRDFWELSNEEVRIRLEEYVQNLPIDDFEDLHYLLEIPLLAKHARNRINNVTHEEVYRIRQQQLPDPLVDKLVSLYCEVESYSDANKIGALLDFNANLLNPSRVGEIVKCAKLNYSIYKNDKITVLAKTLLEDGKISRDTFDELWLLDSRRKSPPD